MASFSEPGNQDLPFLMDNSKLTYLGGAPRLGKQGLRKPVSLGRDESEPSKEEEIKINTRWEKEAVESPYK